MATVEKSPPLDSLPEPVQKNGGGVIKRSWKFTRNLARENGVWAALRGARKGGYLITEAATGIIYVLSLPIAVQPMAIAACAALIGVGLFGICYGFTGAWGALEGFCDRTFKTFNPLKNIRLYALDKVRKIAKKPFAQKLSRRIGKLADSVRQNPRFQKFLKNRVVQKALNSRFVKVAVGGLTPKQREVFLAALTVQGSLAAIAILSIGIASQGIAAPLLGLPAVTIAGGVTAAMVIRAGLLGTNVFGLFRGSKDLIKAYRERKKAKRAKREAGLEPVSPAVLSTPPVSETKAASAFTNSAPAFNAEADKKMDKEGPAAAAMPAPRPAAPSTP